MKKIKVGIIGMGYIGESHIEAVRRIGCCELYAVADTNAELAKAKADYYGIEKCYSSVEDLLADPEIDVNYGDDGQYQGTGRWDLMASGDKNNRKHSPAHPNPYIKTEIFDWVNATELSGKNRLYKLRPSELDGNSIYKISTTTPNEYYFLENRQDENLDGTGLLIYHIHSNITPINFWFNNLNNTHPQKVYVVDANNHIEKSAMETPESYGNINSAYATFRDTLSENMYFTSTSLPSNCAWNGTPTQNKNVCFISEEMIDGEKCVKFVLNPEIEGPEVLCDSAIYSLKHVPSDATVEWTYIRTSDMLSVDIPVYIGSGQGTKEACYRRGVELEASNGSVENPDIPILPVPTSAGDIAPTAIGDPVYVPYTGYVTIKVNITLNGNTYSLTKRIYMPEEVKMNTLNLGFVNLWYTGTTKTITLKSPTDEELMNDIEWYIELPGRTPYYEYGSSITVTPTNSGTARFTATYVNGCDDENMSHTTTYSVVRLAGLTYENPASGSVEINVTNGEGVDELGMRTMSVNSQPTPYMGAYRVELWHDVYGKVREMDVPENNPTVTMSLEGLNSGVYVMRLIIDNQVVEASQLIVR